MSKDGEGRNILQYLVKFSPTSKIEEKLIKILLFLKEEYGIDVSFIKDILCSRDSCGQDMLGYLLIHCSDISTFKTTFFNFLEFIKNHFDTNSNIIKTILEDNQSVIFSMASYQSSDPNYANTYKTSCKELEQNFKIDGGFLKKSYRNQIPVEPKILGESDLSELESADESEDVEIEEERNEESRFLDLGVDLGIFDNSDSDYCDDDSDSDDLLDEDFDLSEFIRHQFKDGRLFEDYSDSESTR
jgi:hypothetical protein